MTTMSAGRLRRQIRRAANVRGWTLRQKVAVGVWIPVLIVAFALFTGPNRASSASAGPEPTTTTTFAGTVPTLQPIVPVALSKAKKVSLHDRVVKWVKGVPPRRSPAEKLALLNYLRSHRVNSRLRSGAGIILRRGARLRAGH